MRNPGGVITHPAFPGRTPRSGPRSGILSGALEGQAGGSAAQTQRGGLEGGRVPLPGRPAGPVHPVPTHRAVPSQLWTQEHFSFSGPTRRGSSSGRKAEGGEGGLYFQAMGSALPQAFSVDSQSLLDPNLLIGLSVCLSPTYTACCLSGRASTRPPELSSPGQAPFLLQSLIHLGGKARAGPPRALPAAPLVFLSVVRGERK